jgi:hypothetical protein
MGVFEALVLVLIAASGVLLLRRIASQRPR